MSSRRGNARRDVLVGVLNQPRDLEFVLNHGWYRVPVDTAPKSNFPPRWIAFYEGKSIRPDFGIYRYARVRGSELATREDLFPGELHGFKRDRLYHRLVLAPVQERSHPIVFLRNRPFAFLQTTMTRFEAADNVNDLFLDSPLEDILWREFKSLNVPAERQWQESVGDHKYYLDFAVFCRDGKIDVEADGDSYHITTEQAPRDNTRNNELAAHGWHVLRFESDRIRKRLSTCVESVLETVQRLKGYKSDAVVPTKFVKARSGGIVTQPSLFE